MSTSITIQPNPSIEIDLAVEGNAVEITTRQVGEWGAIATLPLPVLRATLDALENGERAQSPGLMDGGVTAALVEQDVAGSYTRTDEQSWDFNSGAGSSFPSPSKGLRYQRERDDARAMASLWKETARREFQFRALARTGRDFWKGTAEKAQEARDAAIQERDNKAAAYDALLGLFRDVERAAIKWKARAEHPLTAREHLKAAWEAANEPEDGVIPAGADYLWRNTVSGRIVQGVPDHVDSPAEEGERIVRRLLDPPVPTRPEGADQLDPIIDAAIRGHSDITSPAVVHAIADALAEEGVTAPEVEA